MSDELGNEYKEYITEVPDFPKPGIGFKDISPLLADISPFIVNCPVLVSKKLDELISNLPSEPLIYCSVVPLPDTPNINLDELTLIPFSSNVIPSPVFFPICTFEILLLTSN